jgi:hypothetical protein
MSHILRAVKGFMARRRDAAASACIAPSRRSSTRLGRRVCPTSLDRREHGEEQQRAGHERYGGVELLRVADDKRAG